MVSLLSPMANGDRIGKRCWVLAVLVLALLTGAGLANISCGGDDPRNNRPHDIFMSANVTTEDDLLELLPQYEAAGIEFERGEVSGGVTYLHERTIDGMKVHGDRFFYLFDKKTNRLIGKEIRWRDDLPEHLPPLAVTKEQAESMVEGEAYPATLDYIFAESVVFKHIKPMPKNPCWVVWSVVAEHEDWTEIKITVIDAVTGKILGYGVPPPSANGSED